MGVIGSDPFGAADGGFERQKVCAGSFVGKNRGLPFCFSQCNRDPYPAEPPAWSSIALFDKRGLFFVDVGKMPRSLFPRPEHNL